MFWSRPITSGNSPALRAHTATIVDHKMYVFGGTTETEVSSDLYIFDTTTFRWSVPNVVGDVGPHRAHTSTYIKNGNSRKIFVFGGGHDTYYFNTLYTLDLDTMVWSKPKSIGNPPGARRGHTANSFDNYIYIFGGGDGLKALSDVWRLNTDSYEWELLECKGEIPIPRGYHTTEIWCRKLVVYGGSDGVHCFGDIHLLDLDSLEWKKITNVQVHPRLSHSAVMLGDILVILCGHGDGTSYVDVTLFFNLRSNKWVDFKILGQGPTPRGYHTTVYDNSRIILYGGFDGGVYNSTYLLDLGMYSYLVDSKKSNLLEEESLNFRKRL